MSNINPNEWLRDNGASMYPPCAFESIGATIVGRVIDTPRVVTTNMDGQEQQSYVIGVEVQAGTVINIGKAGERRPAAPGDEVSIWVKRGNMANELQTAVARAGAQGVAVGGTIAIRYIGDGQRSPGKSPPKLYQCQYAPPVTQVAVADLIPGVPQPPPNMTASPFPNGGTPMAPSQPFNPTPPTTSQPVPELF